MATSTEAVEVQFVQDRVTKNTIRFEEAVESDLDVRQIGTLYVPKPTLAALGFKEGDRLLAKFEVLS